MRNGLPKPELWAGEAVTVPAPTGEVLDQDSAAVGSVPDDNSGPATAVVPVAEAVAESPAFEPPAMVPEVARGRYMGTALYYPALEVLGLVETARKCSGCPTPGSSG